MTTPTIGQQLKAARMARGLTQRELSEGLVTAGLISQIEQDRVLPTPELLRTLLERLSIQDDDMIVELEAHQRSKHLIREAQTLANQRRIHEAVPLYLEAIAVSPTPERLDYVYDEVAEHCISVDWLDGALQVLSAGIISSRRKNDPSGLIHRVFQMGQIYLRKGSPGRAQRMWRMAWRLTQAHPAHVFPQRFRLLANLGKSYLLLDQCETALDFYQEAAGVAWKSGDQAIVYHGAGNAYLGMGEFSKADACFQHAITLYQAAGQIAGEQQCRANRGVVMRCRGELELGEVWFRDLLQDSVFTRDATRVANAKQELALCLFGLGRMHEGLRETHEALQMSGVKRDVRAFIYESTVRALVQHGRLTEARRFANQWGDDDLPSKAGHARIRFVTGCAMLVDGDDDTRSAWAMLRSALLPEQ